MNTNKPGQAQEKEEEDDDDDEDEEVEVVVAGNPGNVHIYNTCTQERIKT